MRVLVTGGTGFIGRHFVPALLSGGHEVVLLDLWRPRSLLPSRAVTFVQGDVRNNKLVRETAEGCEAVLHLAAAHHDFGIDRGTYFSVNEGGTEAVSAAMSFHDIDRICFLSSVAVYGDDAVLPDESGATMPTGPYGSSKLAAEQVLRRWTEGNERRSTLIIRPCVTFGRDNYANVFKLIRQIERRLFLPVGEGRNRKSMAFVTNLVDATLHAWRRSAPGVTLFNYVDKPDLSSRQIVEAVYTHLGRRAPRLSVPLGLALALAMPIDLLSRLSGRRFPITTLGIRKLAGLESTFAADRIRQTGFEPSVSLDEGIGRMVDWYVALTPGDEESPRLPPREVVLTAEPGHRQPLA